MDSVVISVIGGVASVVSKPKGTRVDIVDLDTDGVPDEDLCKCNLVHKSHVHDTFEPEM